MTQCRVVQKIGDMRANCLLSVMHEVRYRLVSVLYFLYLYVLRGLMRLAALRRRERTLVAEPWLGVATVAIADEQRPDFKGLTGNDLGRSTWWMLRQRLIYSVWRHVAPEGVCRVVTRCGRRWKPGFYELNDFVAILGFLAFP